MQCEKCHGPGSEYMDEAVMRDREAAMKAGLRRFTKRDCAVCHYVKGSHVAVHHKPHDRRRGGLEGRSLTPSPRAPGLDPPGRGGAAAPRRPGRSTWAPSPAARATRDR